MLTWKIVEASEASVIYIYIYIKNRTIYIYIERERERERDLGTVLRYCSLGFLFKILPCGFFFM